MSFHEYRPGVIVRAGETLWLHSRYHCGETRWRFDAKNGWAYVAGAYSSVLPLWLRNPPTQGGPRDHDRPDFVHGQLPE